MKKSVLFLLMLMAGTFSFAQSKRELVRERVDNVWRKNYEKGNFDTLYMTRPDSKFYQPEAVQYKILAADNGAKARELAKWKQSVADVWDKIQVTSFDISKEIGPGTVISGEPYTITLTVDEQGLNDAIGVEMVVITTDDMGRDKVYKVFPFDVVSNQGSVYTFRLKASLDNAGTFRTAYRLYPKNSLLVHRQNFCYVKWFTK